MDKLEVSLRADQQEMLYILLNEVFDNFRDFWNNAPCGIGLM
jgi:hypothetical protein